MVRTLLPRSTSVASRLTHRFCHFCLPFLRPPDPGRRTDSVVYTCSCNIFTSRWHSPSESPDGSPFVCDPEEIHYMIQLYYHGCVGAHDVRLLELFLRRSHPRSKYGIKPLSWKTSSLDFKILAFGVDPTINFSRCFGRRLGNAFVSEAMGCPFGVMPSQLLGT